MRSPKEEAEELVKQFVSTRIMSYRTTIQCAIICVDKIINEIEEEIKPYSYEYDIDMWDERIDHWKQVKLELEKMK